MHPTSFALLTASILLTIINSGILHRFESRGLDNPGDVLLFNGAMSLVWVLLVLCVGREFSTPIIATVLIGTGYGVVTAGLLLSKTQALATGNMSVTVLLGCSSLMLPTILGSVLWHERVEAEQSVGLVLLLVAMALCVDKHGSGATGQRWKLYSALFFLFSGLSGLIIKIQQNLPGKEKVPEMLLIASVVASALLILSAFIVNHRGHTPKPKLPRSSWRYVLVCGICSCAHNWLNIGLAGKLPSVLFFPLFNGSVILGSSLTSRLCFGEPLTRQQLCGLLCGVLAFLMIGKVF